MTEHVLDPDIWVDEYGDAMLRYAYSRLGDQAKAEDCVQEAFMAAYKSRDRYKGTHAPKAWLMGILKHKIVDYIRKASRETVTEDVEVLQAYESPLYKYSGIPTRNPRAWAFDPALAAENSDFWIVFQDCLSKLKGVHHDAFVLRELEGKSTEEICNELDVTANYLCVLFHRARLSLKECLEINWLDSAKSE